MNTPAISLIGAVSGETLGELPFNLPGRSKIIWVITDSTTGQSWINRTDHPRRSIRWFLKKHKTEGRQYQLGVTPPLYNSGDIITKFCNQFPHETLDVGRTTRAGYLDIVEFLVSQHWNLSEEISGSGDTL